MEYTTVEFTTDKWAAIKEYLQLTPDIDYTLKRVRVKDDMFKEDAIHKQLKDKANKAYKELETYSFNKRHNIK